MIHRGLWSGSLDDKMFCGIKQILMKIWIVMECSGVLSFLCDCNIIGIRCLAIYISKMSRLIAWHNLSPHWSLYLWYIFCVFFITDVYFHYGWGCDIINDAFSFNDCSLFIQDVESSCESLIKCLRKLATFATNGWSSTIRLDLFSEWWVKSN